MTRSIFVFYILILVCILESIRFKNAFHDCAYQHESDKDLISRDVCLFPEDRLKFKDAVDCEGAERRLRLTIFICTLYSWSSESITLHVWHTLTGSYWAMCGILLPLLIAYMHFWSQRKLQMDVMGQFGKYLKLGEKKKKKSKNAISYR